MRIVITGGCGFIGRALARRLIDKIDASDEIIIVDTMQSLDNCVELNELLHPQIKIAGVDLADAASFDMIPIDQQSMLQSNLIVKHDFQVSAESFYYFMVDSVFTLASLADIDAGHNNTQVQMNYFNSASSKFFHEIMNILKGIQEGGKSVKVSWSGPGFTKREMTAEDLSGS